MLKLKKRNDLIFVIIILLIFVISLFFDNIMYIPITFFLGCLAGSIAQHKDISKVEKDDFSLNGMNLVINMALYIAAGVISAIFFGVNGFIVAMIGLISYRQRLLGKISKFEGVKL